MSEYETGVVWRERGYFLVEGVVEDRVGEEQMSDRTGTCSAEKFAVLANKAHLFPIQRFLLKVQLIYGGT